MKSHLLTLFEAIIVMTLFVSSVVAAYTPGAGIKNSPHDLSATSAYYYPFNRYNPERETQICIFCHLPNNPTEGSGTGSTPIWTHASSAVTRFEPYTNGHGGPRDPNRKLSADVSSGPGPVSRVCLGCHDGTVAVNRYGSVTGNVYISETDKVGKNGVLSNHHPIGFVYSAVVDNEINQFAILGGHPVAELLSDGRMECITCHDVHNSRNSGEKLLRMSDRRSGLCCSCHRKCSR
jgi:predicted CXXCH cytochrome family protein